MAAQVGPTGDAVGLDSSQAMITEASMRHRHLPQVSFWVGDAHALPFESDSFDACRAERTLQHLYDPDRAVAEIARVLRVGGRVALLDPDFETLVIAGADPALSTRIWLNHMQRHPHPRIGRHLRGLLTTNGFVDITVDAGVVMHTELGQSKRAFGLAAAAVRAAENGVVTRSEVESWLADLQQASETDQFFCAVTGFRAAGVKGGGPRHRQSSTRAIEILRLKARSDGQPLSPAVSREQLDGPTLDGVMAGAEGSKRSGGDRVVTVTGQRQKNVFGTDVVVSELKGFLYGASKRLDGAGGKRFLGLVRTRASLDESKDLLFHRGLRDT